MPTIAALPTLAAIPVIMNATLVGNSTISNSTNLVGNPEVHSKHHAVFDAALGIGCIITVLFMILVLYVVTHMEQTKLAALKATIRDQKQKLKGLRKLKKKDDETRRMLLGDDMTRLPRVGKPLGIGRVVEGQWNVGKVNSLKSVKERK